MLKALDSLTKVIVALAALGAFILSWNNNNRITETKKSVNEVHLMVNSRLTELLDVTRSSSRAKGVEQERERQKEQDKSK